MLCDLNQGCLKHWNRGNLWDPGWCPFSSTWITQIQSPSALHVYTGSGPGPWSLWFIHRRRVCCLFTPEFLFLRGSLQAVLF